MIKTIFRTFLLGLGIGVLVAPRPGSETRQMLSERFNRLFGSQDGTSSVNEWERPLGNTAGSSVTPSQHYVEPAISSSTTSPTFGTTTPGTSSTTLADTDIGGATNI